MESIIPPYAYYETKHDNGGHMVAQSSEIAQYQGSQRLPLDVLILIADRLERHQDIVSLALACKDLNHVLMKTRRRSLEISFRGHWAGRSRIKGPRYRVVNQRAATIEAGFGIYSSYSFPCAERLVYLLDGHDTCWWGHVDETKSLWHRFHELVTGVKELTLSGSLPHRNLSTFDQSLRTRIWSNKHSPFRPESLIVNLHWEDWSFDVLQRMSLYHLKTLKLPLSKSSDCRPLGVALRTMPRLVSLTITDITDQEDFLAGLIHIGNGIMSCASTLRELDLEMTNSNRPPSWAGDEAFIEPEEPGLLFSKIFPYPSLERLIKWNDRYRRVGTDPMKEAPLHLTTLRLKHLSLPWYAFGLVFDAASIKNLHLPHSEADEAVWIFLRLYAHLDKLTNINLEMLSALFFEFLEQQTSLKELNFARPQKNYRITDLVSYGTDTDIIYQVVERGTQRGQVAKCQNWIPDDLMYSLNRMTTLTHLVLPANMFTITSECLVIISALTSLEHLDFGFHYENEVLQRDFISFFFLGSTNLKKITFRSFMRRRPYANFDSANLLASFLCVQAHISKNLKFLRFKPLDENYVNPHECTEVFYHRETPVDGKWWIQLPLDEGEEMFTEGRTPRIVPVSKWDWEAER